MKKFGALAALAPDSATVATRKVLDLQLAEKRDAHVEAERTVSTKLDSRAGIVGTLRELRTELLRGQPAMGEARRWSVDAAITAAHGELEVAEQYVAAARTDLRKHRDDYSARLRADLADRKRDIGVALLGRLEEFAGVLSELLEVHDFVARNSCSQPLKIVAIAPQLSGDLRRMRAAIEQATK